MNEYWANADDWNQRIAEQSMISPYDGVPTELLPEPPREWSDLQDYLLSIADEWEWDGEIPF